MRAPSVVMPARHHGSEPRDRDRGRAACRRGDEHGRPRGSRL